MAAQPLAGVRPDGLTFSTAIAGVPMADIRLDGRAHRRHRPLCRCCSFSADLVRSCPGSPLGGLEIERAFLEFVVGCAEGCLQIIRARPPVPPADQPHTRSLALAISEVHLRIDAPEMKTGRELGTRSSGCQRGLGKCLGHADSTTRFENTSNIRRISTCVQERTLKYKILKNAELQ